MNRYQGEQNYERKKDIAAAQSISHEFYPGIAVVVATTSSLAGQDLAQTTTSATSESPMNIFSDLQWSPLEC
jgi:hypothetical protein